MACMHLKLWKGQDKHCCDQHLLCSHIKSNIKTTSNWKDGQRGRGVRHMNLFLKSTLVSCIMNLLHQSKLRMIKFEARSELLLCLRNYEPAIPSARFAYMGAPTADEAASPEQRHTQASVRAAAPYVISLSMLLCTDGLSLAVA